METLGRGGGGEFAFVGLRAEYYKVLVGSGFYRGSRI